MKSCILIALSILTTARAYAQAPVAHPRVLSDSLAGIALPRVYDLRIPASISPDAYTRSFGFFCKQELLLEKKNIPVHFRMGDQEQCNYLESKGHADIPVK